MVLRRAWRDENYRGRCVQAMQVLFQLTTLTRHAFALRPIFTKVEGGGGMGRPGRQQKSSGRDGKMNERAEITGVNLTQK